MYDCSNKFWVASWELPLNSPNRNIILAEYKLKLVVVRIMLDYDS